MLQQSCWLLVAQNLKSKGATASGPMSDTTAHWPKHGLVILRKQSLHRILQLFLLCIPAVHTCCAFLLCIPAKQIKQCSAMILSCCVLQLLNWYKRRHSPVDGCRLYRLAPHCTAAPSYLLLKAVPQPQLTSLDPRGVFVAHCQDELYLWQVGCIVLG